MYQYLVDDNSENKTNGENKNVVATISHNEYKDSINIIQSNDHRIRSSEINKIFLSCFDDKIYIQNNGCNGLLALGYQN